MIPAHNHPAETIPPPNTAVLTAAEPVVDGEAAAVAAVVIMEPSLMVIDIMLPVSVAAAVAGRLDKLASEVNAAVRPVTFVQSEGSDVAAPETKFSAAH